MDEATDYKRQISQLAARNQKLAGLLKESRGKLEQLFAELNALAEPASTYGVFLGYLLTLKRNSTTSSGCMM